MSLRIGIASHIVVDTIGANGSVTNNLGGPPGYCGITSRRFNFEVALATRFGIDFPKEHRDFLLKSKILLYDSQQSDDKPTTRFNIVLEGDSRRMTLLCKCAPLSVEEIASMKVDCWLVSPVIDEISPEVLAAIKSNAGSRNFVMLDPQGYMRAIGPDGSITPKATVRIDLAGIRAIKVDEEEMRALTGGIQGLDGMRFLQSQGVEFIVSTLKNEIHLLHKRTHYWIKMREIDTPDSTGAGDILSAAFCCAYLKEKDPLWALCFGAGAVRAALETGQIGLAKIPPMSKIEESASYFYNTVGFQQLS